MYIKYVLKKRVQKKTHTISSKDTLIIVTFLKRYCLKSEKIPLSERYLCAYIEVLICSYIVQICHWVSKFHDCDGVSKIGLYLANYRK